MYNSAFDGELYNDRNQSFRKAVRAPKKSQRYFDSERNDSEEARPDRPSTTPSRNVEDSNETTNSWAKYNWKRFLPWAPRAKGYVSKLVR